MGTDAGEVLETLPNPIFFKVHRTMCTELMRLVDRILRIFPDIEAARPRCSSGIQSLCLLSSALDKAKLLLQHCCDCSKLYLAVTGDTVLSRCEKARRSFEQSLGQIQNMVPVMLAVEISQIRDDLGCATFVLDSVEDEAGRVVKELLQHDASVSDSMENSEIKALQFAAARLNITSRKAVLIEVRSIKKLLDKLGPNDQKKKMVLRYLLHLLKKYGNFIMEEQMEKVYVHSEGPIATENSSHDSLHDHYVKSDSEPCLSYDHCRTLASELGRVIPPEEYKCPISSRVMYDPVVIASGVTYERMWIQKWFDEGKNTCPKTGKKLAHMSLTPNIAMKDLISKWCRNNGVAFPDPTRQAEVFHCWDASSTSIRSFGSSMNDFHVPVDLSSMSLGSLDNSYDSDSSHAKTAHGLNLMLTKTNENPLSLQSQVQIHDTDLMLLSKLSDLQWDSQCQVIEDLKSCLKCNYRVLCSMSSDDFLKPLTRFLSNAYDLHDIKALRNGIQLMSEFVNNCGKGLTYGSEDTFTMLATFIDSEARGDALSVMEELSGYQNGKANTVSSVLTPILKVLESESAEFQQQAIRIMYNLSFNGELCSHMVSRECISKLLPFFRDRALLRYCICMLKNLSDTEEGRISVAETKGCISSVAEILETGSNEEQEHALAVFVSLCSQRVDYCQLVMDEGVIPSLVYISKNGNDKGKANALELLRLLRDAVYEKEESIVPNLNNSRDFNDHSQEKKSSKTSGLLKKLSMFSKASSLASKNKRLK